MVLTARAYHYYIRENPLGFLVVSGEVNFKRELLSFVRIYIYNAKNNEWI